MQVDETHGRHLVLTPPEGEFREVVVSLMRAFAQTYGGPDFIPHVTLLSATEAPVEELQTLANALAHERAPRITFDAVQTGKDFFVSCYLRVLPTPELHALNHIAQEAFSMSYTFMPHLSLFYGLCEEGTHEAMQQQALTRLAPYLNTGITFSTLELWETPGRAENWKVLEQYSFHS